MRIARVLLLAAALGVVAGCSPWDDSLRSAETVCAPDVDEAPCSSGVKAETPYSFRLLTHCGIEWAYLDGRYWVPRKPVQTPPDWAAITEGTVTLTSEGQATFRRDGHAITFAPAPAGFEPRPCA